METSINIPLLETNNHGLLTNIYTEDMTTIIINKLSKYKYIFLIIIIIISIFYYYYHYYYCKKYNFNNENSEDDNLDNNNNQKALSLKILEKQRLLEKQTNEHHNSLMNIIKQLDYIKNNYNSNNINYNDNNNNNYNDIDNENDNNENENDIIKQHNLTHSEIEDINNNI